MGFFGELFHHDDAQKQNEYIYETEYVPEQHKASFTHEGTLAPVPSTRALLTRSSSDRGRGGLRGDEGVRGPPARVGRRAESPAHEGAPCGLRIRRGRQARRDQGCARRPTVGDRPLTRAGLDHIDRERAKKQAIAQAHALAEERYGEGQNGMEYMRSNGGFEEDYDPHYGRRHGQSAALCARVSQLIGPQRSTTASTITARNIAGTTERPASCNIMYE